MKNRVSRELNALDNKSEDKLKLFKNMMTEKHDATESRFEVNFQLMKEKQEEFKRKMDKVEESDVIIDYIKTEVRRLHRDFTDGLHSS